MHKAEDLFKAAPRVTREYDLNGICCHLRQMTVTESMEYSKYSAKHKGDYELLYAYLLSICCQELVGTEPKEIIEKLDASVLMDMGNEVLDMSTNQKKS